MSEATDQLGSSPPMELRQMGVTKGRKMYLNIGEGRWGVTVRSGAAPDGLCIGTLNIQVKLLAG